MKISSIRSCDIKKAVRDVFVPDGFSFCVTIAENRRLSAVFFFVLFLLFARLHDIVCPNSGIGKERKCKDEQHKRVPDAGLEAQFIDVSEKHPLYDSHRNELEPPEVM